MSCSDFSAEACSVEHLDIASFKPSSKDTTYNNNVVSVNTVDIWEFSWSGVCIEITRIASKIYYNNIL